MYISGTCHKGLGANHYYKVLVSDNDHLEFYEVGKKAISDPVGALTGCLEFGVNNKALIAAGMNPERILNSLEVTPSSSDISKMSLAVLDGDTQYLRNGHIIVSTRCFQEPPSMRFILKNVYYNRYNLIMSNIGPTKFVNVVCLYFTFC